MKHIITILLLFISINVFGQMPIIWNSNSGSKKINVGTWTMKVQYPYDIVGAETGITFFAEKSNVQIQPQHMPIVLLSTAGIYFAMGVGQKSDGGSVLGFYTYLVTDYKMIGWKPIQFTFTNGKARITFGPSIFYQRIWSGWCDSSGNHIGWDNYTYQTQDYYVNNGYDYKDFGIGLHVNVNRIVTFALYACKHSLSFGIGIWIGIS